MNKSRANLVAFCKFRLVYVPPKSAEEEAKARIKVQKIADVRVLVPLHFVKASPASSSLSAGKGCGKDYGKYVGQPFD